MDMLWSLMMEEHMIIMDMFIMVQHFLSPQMDKEILFLSDYRSDTMALEIRRVVVLQFWQ